jgi:hypothetical protein
MPPDDSARWIDHSIAALILAAFLVTFLTARVIVLLIMLRKIPTLYLRASQTHVHHLNYGIFLLSVVGGYVLIVQPAGHWLAAAAVVYAVGLALTFDEFGMWIHLGGPYWQRASLDAITVVAGILLLIVLAPDLERFETLHWATVIILALLAFTFGLLLLRSMRFARDRISPMLLQIEARGPAE